jgi:iron complex outermembrane recepter protein
MKTISLFFMLLVALTHFCAKGQAIEMSGLVITHDNKEIQNVHIYVQENGYTTATDNKGNFKIIANTSDTLTLIFTHIGFKTHTEKVAYGNKNLIIVLESVNYQLNGITVTEDRIDEIKLQNAGNVTSIDAAFIEANMGGNLINSLEKIPGIQASNVGPSMSKPLIRGNSGYRILIAKNNIKQEEQYWNMHQGIAIDQYSVEEIEIIKGPASLYYGSDAIGGVLNIKNTLAPSIQGTKAEIAFTGKTNNDWLGVHLKVQTRKNDFFVKISASQQEFGDYKVPADSFEYKPMHYAGLRKNLENTAGKESAFQLHTGIIKPRLYSYFIMSYYRDHSGFFAFSAGQELINADTAVHFASTRDVLMPSIKAENTDIQHHTIIYRNKFKYNLYAGVQFNTSSEYDIINDITGYRTEDVERFSKTNLDLEYELMALSAGLHSHYNDTGRYSVNSGFTMQHQQNKSDGFSHLLPEFKRNTAGIYTIHKLKINNKWMIQAGIRGDINKMHIEESLNPNPLLADSIFNESMNLSFPGLSFSCGLVYSNKKNMILKFHLGKSYRTPAVYELSSYGIHRHNLRFEKGNSHLNPEVAYQADIVAEYKTKNTFVSFSPFISYFTNYIYLTPTPDFALGTFTGQIYEYRQNTSLQYGSELMLQAQVFRNFNTACAFEFVYAMNHETYQALPYTPPASAIPEVYYITAKKDFRIGIEAVCVAPQNVIAINENSTPGYVIYNLRSGKTMKIGKQEISVLFSIQNMTNKKYLNHLSYYRRLQIPEPGRNFILTVKIPFQTNINN